MEYKVVTSGTEWRTPPRVCRCCLSEGCYKDISSEYYWMGEKETYAEMLKECFDLTISLEDVGNTNSRLICEVCITRLRDASNFKKQVVNSEKRFAEHMRTGTGLSALPETADTTYAEVKIEGVKDEGVISDDDPGPEDDTYDDPDYDESDSLPLKYEVQKKEALGDISFGDEIPTLSNPEMTIRRVSKSKEKPAKKMKLNKKELTIKPVKASGSKTKSAKAAKAAKAAKEPKAAKKGPIYEFIENSIRKRKLDLELNSSTPDKNNTAGPSFKPLPKDFPQTEKEKSNAKIILEFSTAVPFRTGLSGMVCAYCGDVFTEPIALREHTRGQHNTHNVFSVFVNLRKDQMVKVDLLDLSCKLCSERLDLNSLKTHLKDVHGKEIDDSAREGVVPFALVKDNWKCYVCSKKFMSFRTLSSHMGDHFQNYTCENCGKSFMQRHELQTHAKTHETSKPAESTKKMNVFRSRCTKCNERFLYHDQRWKHMVKVHGLEAPTFKCTECPSTFKRRSARHRHMSKVHNLKNNFKCPHCSSTFVTKAKLDQHVGKHLEERNDCQVCGKTYALQKSLREHMKVHSNESIVCSACGQAFVQRVNYKQHIRVHHPDIALDSV